MRECGGTYQSPSSISIEVYMCCGIRGLRLYANERHQRKDEMTEAEMERENEIVVSKRG